MKVLVAPHNAMGLGRRHGANWGDDIAVELLCFIWVKNSRKQHTGSNQTVLITVCHRGYNKLFRLVLSLKKK